MKSTKLSFKTETVGYAIYQVQILYEKYFTNFSFKFYTSLKIHFVKLR